MRINVHTNLCTYDFFLHYLSFKSLSLIYVTLWPYRLDNEHSYSKSNDDNRKNMVRTRCTKEVKLLLLKPMVSECTRVVYVSDIHSEHTTYLECSKTTSPECCCDCHGTAARPACSPRRRQTTSMPLGVKRRRRVRDNVNSVLEMFAHRGDCTMLSI